MPTFEIRLRKGEEDPPLLHIGCFSRHLDQDFFTAVPFNTERKACYEIADNLAIYINRQNLGWTAQTDRQHLYNDFKRLHWEFRERQHYTLTTEDTTEIYDLVNAQHLAEQKARALLFDLNAQLCEKVDKGKAFYLQGTRYVYIIHPNSKKIDVLYPTGPISLCVYIQDSTVQHNKYDWALAMWKYLVAAEQHVLTTANHFDFYLNVDTQEVTIAQDGQDIRDTNDGTTPFNLLEGTRQTGEETPPS